MDSIQKCFKVSKSKLLSEWVSLRYRMGKARRKACVKALLLWLEAMKPILRMECRRMGVVQHAKASSFAQQIFLKIQQKAMLKLDEYSQKSQNIEEPWVRELSKKILEIGADIILSIDGFKKNTNFASSKKKQTPIKHHEHTTHRKTKFTILPIRRT